jgi:exodeoxyribonuclease V alpha subunit
VPPPAPSATLTGVLERIIFHNEENHYTIAEFRPDTRPAAIKTPASSDEKIEKVTIVGALPSVECGETLHLTGEWTQHSQHGAQFKIATF